jgi:DNA (cytosine-5)-methyltransferase 1
MWKFQTWKAFSPAESLGKSPMPLAAFGKNSLLRRTGIIFYETAACNTVSETERTEYNRPDSQPNPMKPTFYEFFAGGGMVSQGLGDHWECLFANDFDEMKARAYRANNDPRPFVLGDVTKVRVADLPGEADLSWASFPCQDLSLAGEGAGLKGERSGTFWPFWKLMRGLAKEGRAPKVLILENVVGAITSHDGKDLAAIAKAFAELGYKFGCIVIDAAYFVPQSRPRLFIIGIRSDLAIPAGLLADEPSTHWHPRSLLKATSRFSKKSVEQHLLWSLPRPPLRNIGLSDVIEDEPKGVEWHAAAYTKRLINLMDDNNRRKVSAAKKEKRRVVGAVYRRTRPDGAGGKVQRAEIRFDDVAGCLRTPAGGSSRQTILIVESAKIRSRLLSRREAARLMGLQDHYVLPDRYNDAYHLLGDGVVAPVVEYLARQIVEPVLTANRMPMAAE